MVNFWAMDTVPAQFRERNLYRHNPNVTLMRTTPDECARIGRDPKQIEITAAAPGPDLDAIRRLEDQGVSRLVMGPPGFDRKGVRAGLEKFADAVLAKLS